MDLWEIQIRNSVTRDMMLVVEAKNSHVKFHAMMALNVFTYSANVAIAYFGFDQGRFALSCLSLIAAGFVVVAGVRLYFAHAAWMSAAAQLETTLLKIKGWLDAMV